MNEPANLDDLIDDVILETENLRVSEMGPSPHSYLWVALKDELLKLKSHSGCFDSAYPIYKGIMRMVIDELLLVDFASLDRLGHVMQRWRQDI